MGMYVLILLAYASIRVHTDAPQLRAIDVCVRMPAGLGRFSPR